MTYEESRTTFSSFLTKKKMLSTFIQRIFCKVLDIFFIKVKDWGIFLLISSIQHFRTKPIQLKLLSLESKTNQFIIQ